MICPICGGPVSTDPTVWDYEPVCVSCGATDENPYSLTLPMPEPPKHNNE